MRYCGQLKHNIKQECKLNLGGVDKIYLINFKDFVTVLDNDIILKTNSVAYELDAARNLTTFVQTAVNGVGDNVYINNVLQFTLMFHSANLEDSLMNLTLGYFKILIRYNNGYWRFVDEIPDFYFKMESIVSNSGANDTDENAVTLSYVLNGHSYGLLYEEMPNIVTDQSTEPIWALINTECEEK